MAYIALLLAHVTLRVLNPIASVNPHWCKESIPSAVQRLISALNSLVHAKLDKPHMVDMWFSCYLPLIKVQLVSAAKTVESSERIIDTVIKICDLHVSDDQVKASTCTM